MKHLRRIFVKFYLLFANSKVEAELAREIGAHLMLLEDEYLRQGMTREDARRAARVAYGGVEQATQLHRDERAFQGLGQILQDTRYSLRQLRRSLGFTVTAILMLALGIGATTAIFSIVEGVLLRPLPFPDPDRLVILGDVLEGSHCASCAHSSVTAPDIRNYMRDTQSFSHLGGYRQRLFELSGTGDPAAVNATRMSGEVFAALGVPPLLGRTFTQHEDEEGQQVAVLSYGMWRSRFHGDANVLGSKILLYRKPYTVIGVMPRNFEFPLNPGNVNQSELWLPLSLQPEEFTGGSAASWNSRMVGRLKPGITAEQAQSDSERVAQETMRDYPAYMRSLRIHAVATPLQEDTVGQARPLVRALLLAVIVVLLIACANLAGRLLVGGIRGRGEIAVALTLLTASGLLLRSFEKMRDVKLGFRPDNTLAALYVLPQQRYATQSAIDEFTRTLLNDVGHLPGVDAIGITSFLPAAGNNWGIGFTIEGYVSPKGAGLNMAAMSLVESDPFEALGIRVLRGRVFTESDNAGSQLVAIVNRKMAERYWPGQDPIGKRLRRGMPETSTPWMTVVGEVDDVTLESRDAETRPQVYQPVTQTVASEGVFASPGELSAADGWIVLRSRMAPEGMQGTLRATVRKIDPQLPLYQMQTMEHAISKSEAPRRFNTVLISSFAIAAVLLSVLVIYAVIAFSVALREQEMAVRMALGGQRSEVILLILSSGAKLAAVGCGLGLLGAVAASRLLRAFLFEVSPFDPGVLSLSAVAMLLLTLAASALPARRASSTDPMLALRGE